MLKPKRLSGSWFARKKTVKWEFERRLPVRYTASNSPRRTIRAVRGNFRPSGLLGREPMASLLAARRQHLAASDGLHAYAKSVRLRAPPFVRLICSLWQNNPPLFPTMSLQRFLFLITCCAHPAFRSTRSVRRVCPADAVNGPCSGRSLDRSTNLKHTTTDKPPKQPIPNQ